MIKKSLVRYLVQLKKKSAPICTKLFKDCQKIVFIGAELHQLCTYNCTKNNRKKGNNNNYIYIYLSYKCINTVLYSNFIY